MANRITQEMGKQKKAVAEAVEKSEDEIMKKVQFKI